MSKFCPVVSRRVVYLECLECDRREECRNRNAGHAVNMENKQTEKDAAENAENTTD